MGKEENKRYKEFSRYLDRILEGGEVPPGEPVDAELREALDFARKMIELRPDPSPAFQSALKERLLRRLAEREKAAPERRGWFGSWWRSPVWQGVAAVAVVAIVVVVAWRVGVFPTVEGPSTPTETATTTATATTTSTPTATATATATATGLPQTVYISVAVGTDKTVYAAGEAVRIEMTLKNESPQPVTLEGLPPIVSVMQTSTGQPVYTFSGSRETQTLAPDQAVTFTLTWDQLDSSGNPVTGMYYVELEDLVYNGYPVPLHLVDPVAFEITPDL